MEYQATSKYIRSSTRKVRLVADAVRKSSPAVALSQLKQLPNRAGESLFDVIASAIANAKQKNANIEALTFKTIEVMGGPVMKRWHAVSRGQAHAYKKRMSHIRVILTDENSIQKQVNKSVK